MLIIRDAMDGARTFTDFQQRTGIARNMLADRLRRLTGYGLMTQVDAPAGKRKHYELTAAGEDLFPVVLALRHWGENHAFADEEAHSILIDAAGVPVAAPEPVGTDGTPLTSRNTRVVR
jgi:DNA-binding HxlR family transcriptional regulator